MTINPLLCGKCSPIGRRHCVESFCSAPKTSCSAEASNQRRRIVVFMGESGKVGEKRGDCVCANAAEQWQLLLSGKRAGESGLHSVLSLAFFPGLQLLAAPSVGFSGWAESLRLFSTRAQHPVGQGRGCSAVGCGRTLYIYFSMPFRSYTYARVGKNTGKAMATNGRRPGKIFRWSAQHGVSLLHI